MLTASTSLAPGRTATAITRHCTGATVQVGIHPSKCAITKLKMDKDRKNLLDRKSVAKLGEKGKGKISDAENMAGVD